MPNRPHSARVRKTATPKGSPMEENKKQGGKRPDHHYVRMGEVDQAQHPINHRITDGNQGVHAPKAHSIDHLLEKNGTIHLISLIKP